MEHVSASTTSSWYNSHGPVCLPSGFKEYKQRELNGYPNFYSGMHLREFGKIKQVRLAIGDHSLRYRS